LEVAGLNCAATKVVAFGANKAPSGKSIWQQVKFAPLGNFYIAAIPLRLGLSNANAYFSIYYKQ
jgi:hypothetical protein